MSNTPCHLGKAKVRSRSEFKHWLHNVVPEKIHTPIPRGFLGNSLSLYVSILGVGEYFQEILFDTCTLKGIPKEEIFAILECLFLLLLWKLHRSRSLLQSHIPWHTTIIYLIIIINLLYLNMHFILVEQMEEEPALRPVVSIVVLQ